MSANCPASFSVPAGTNGGPPPSPLSQELLTLIDRFNERPTTIGEIFDAMQGRGCHLLLLLIALPFVTPIPLPGVSIPFGLAIALLGARIALDRRPWIPQRLLHGEVSVRALRRLVTGTSRLIRIVELFVRPRLRFVTDHRVFSRIAGLLIAICGGMLVLPVPLPFSNSLPAATVVLLSAGALGRDGLCFFFGCVAFLLSLAFFALVALGGAEAVEILQWIFSR